MPFGRYPFQKYTPTPTSPGGFFDTAALNELADSIRRLGIITPLTVRREGEGVYAHIGRTAAQGVKNSRA